MLSPPLQKSKSAMSTTIQYVPFDELNINCTQFHLHNAKQTKTIHTLKHQTHYSLSCAIYRENMIVI